MLNSFNPKKFFLIAGPCVAENEELCETIADYLVTLSDKFNIPIIFKASYLKANRTSPNSYRGPGLDKGLEILSKIKKKFKLPIITDIHETSEIENVSKVADVLQIPAYLSRQTILLEEAGKTNKWVNLKKGQFLAPWDIKSAVDKVTGNGNEKVIVTERGTCFGYNNLVVDFKGIIFLLDQGFPVVFDATHSVQFPSSQGTSSGGDRNLAPKLAVAAASVGVKGFFFETHPNPEKALCDGANSVYLSNLETIVRKIMECVHFAERLP